MSKVLIVTRVGIKHPMVRCPLTGMGIVFDIYQSRWNGNLDFPTFDCETPLPHTKHNISVSDGYITYPKIPNFEYSEATIELMDWNHKSTKDEAKWLHDNRIKLGIK